MPKTEKTDSKQRIKALAGQPMAISRDALDAMASGAFSFFYDDPPPKPEMAVVDGVAVVPVVGPLAKDDDRWSLSSFASVKAMVSAALADDSVKAILLQINSPGGTVDGALETHDFLVQAAGQKPLYAYADGSMMSAAYWIGSMAKRIAAPATASVGSIGVLTLHVDISKADEKWGEKYTYLTAGRLKAAGNMHEPLGDDARAAIQERLDGIYSLFLDSVTQGRGISMEPADVWADGKIFLAQQAVSIGLVDRVVSDLSEFINQIRETEGINMDLNDFQTKHPDLFSQVIGIGRAEAEKTLDARVSEATATERAGVLALVGVAVGEEAKVSVEKLLAAGVNAEQALAVKGILATAPTPTPAPVSAQAPATDQKAELLAALQASGNQPVAGGGTTTGGKKDFLALVEAHQAQHKCSKLDAMKAVAASHPEAHKEYLAAANPNRTIA